MQNPPSTTNMKIARTFSLGRLQRGQTMTEYVMILSAIAVLAFAGYNALGGSLTSLLAAVDSQL